MIRAIHGAAAVAALLFAGCAPTETGNPPFAAQVALTAHTSDPASAGVGAGSAAPVDVASAWLVVGDVRFVRSAVCDVPGDTEIDVPGPTVADLAAAPMPIPFDLASDHYCRVRVPLDRGRTPLPAGAPPELDDAALVVSGTRRDGAPFLVRSRRAVEIDVRSRTAPFHLDDAARAVLLSFDVARWLAGVDLDAATPDGGGRVVVDDASNRDALDAFEANVDAALALYRDLDEDARLDDSERASPLADGGP